MSDQVKCFAHGHVISSSSSFPPNVFTCVPVVGFQVYDVNSEREKKKMKFSSVRSCCCEITAGRFSEDDKEEKKKKILIHILANSFRRRREERD